MGKARSRVQATDASGLLLVALGAALWASDALFRRQLALELPATVVVAGEHLILTAILFPLVWRMRARLRSLSRVDWTSLLLIGVGSSAMATVLFTIAFTYGDPNTPLLLQKLQPIFAVVGASLILGERLNGRFFVLFMTAITGAYLITFPDPTSVSLNALAPALLASGAAILWAMGTVLGRRMSFVLTPSELTSLRVTVGLVALLPTVTIQHGFEEWTQAVMTSLVPLLLLALIPGLLALLIYYRGLQRTPAAAASVGELAFPLAAITLNYVVFEAVLAMTQWLGVVVLSGTIITMGLIGRRRHGARDLGISSETAPLVAAYANETHS